MTEPSEGIVGPVALVTGGAGFIGSHVARHLLRDGYEVVVIDDLSGGALRNLPTGAHFRRGDICDPAFVDAVFAEFTVDYVFHLAAYAAEGFSHFIKRYNYTSNVIGSVNVINAAVNAGTVRCFVFTSSIAVYGINQVPMSEDLVPAPVDPYGIAKLAVEQELRCTHEMFGLPYVIFRPQTVYGEHQNIGDRYRNVVGIFMNQALRGEPFTVFGDGEQVRTFTHVDDVAPVIARSVTVPAAYNEIFNIGGNAVCTLNEVAAAAAAAMGVGLTVRYLPARDEVHTAYASHDKVRKVFQLTDEPVPLERGLAQMAAWVRRHGPVEPSVFAGVEIRHKLPPTWLAAMETATRTAQ